MYYKHYVVFGTDKTDVLDFVKTNGIPCDETEKSFVLEIREDDCFWPEIHKFIKKYNNSTQVQMFFSKKELEEAEWMEMRCKWYFDFPQPESEYKKITYSSIDYCSVCGSGLVQIDRFRMKKPPNWKRKNFTMVNWVYDEFFISQNAKNILEKSDLKKIQFMPVADKKGNINFEDVFQLCIPTILSPGMVLAENPCEEIICCKNCEHIKYILNGRQLVYKRDIFPDNVDIVKSHETFGGGVICARGIFINQRFYQTLVKNKIDKNLIFEPIKLV